MQKKVVDSLVEECTENTEEKKLVEKTLDENKYGILFQIPFIFFIISIRISIYFTYFVFRKYVNCNKYDLPY